MSDLRAKKLKSIKRMFRKVLELIGTEGTVTRVSGKMRSGKSDFSLRVCEIILTEIDPDLKVMTNIVIDWEGYREKHGKPHPLQDKFIEVTSLKKLFWTLTEIDRGILITDEAGIFASSGASGKRKDLGQWEQIIKLIRKFHVSVIWIDQRGKGSTPPTIREMCSYHIHKPQKYEAEFYEIEYDHRRDDVKEKKIFSLVVPPTYRTGIPYDTYAPGSFEMDLGTVSKWDEKGKETVEVLTARHVFDYTRKVKGRSLKPALAKWLKIFNIDRDDDLTPEQERLLLEELTPPESQPPPKPRPPTEKEIVFHILSKSKEKGMDPPKTSELAKILLTSDAVISRIKKQWREKVDPPGGDLEGARKISSPVNAPS